MIEYRQYRHFLTYHFSNHTNDTANSSSVHIKNSTNTTLQKLKQSVSEMQPIVLLALCLAGVLLITIIVVICCRKYHTRHLYQQSPQNFSSKPNLSLPQLWRIQQKVISKTLPDGQSIVPKETYDGKFIEVAFKTHRNCIYFPVQQTSDCYFEIQIIKLSSVVQIGFVHKDDINSICKEISKGEYQIDFDQYGISVRTDGVTIAYGTNHMNFDWKIEYGDTIGIGLTKHEGFGRVWITRNGIIQNPPSQQQRIKFIDVKSEGKQHITMKKTKNEEDEQEENERQKKEELLAAKRKIEIKIARKFCFYAVIVSESPSNPKRQTILNWNVGGQNFRLYDATTLGGLLG